jgi:hypothetical protein
MKKLRNINLYSVCSKISKRFLVFVRHKGQPVFGLFGTCLAPCIRTNLKTVRKAG